MCPLALAQSLISPDAIHTVTRQPRPPLSVTPPTKPEVEAEPHVLVPGTQHRIPRADEPIHRIASALNAINRRNRLKWTPGLGLSVRVEGRWLTPTRQQRLDFEPDSPSARVSKALASFSEQLPEEAREALDRVPLNVVDMLPFALLHQSDVLDLVRQAPVLALWLSERRAGVHRPLWIPGRMPAPRKLLQQLRLPPKRWIVRAIAKVPVVRQASVYQAALKDTLRARAWDKTWRHCRPLSALALSAMVSAALFQVVLTAQILDEITDAGNRAIVDHVRSACVMLELSEAPTEERVIEDLAEAVLIANREHPVVLSKETFPAPHRPGEAGVIEPILCAEALIEEGETMSHCVGSYTQEAAAGEREFYRVLEPTRATLALDVEEGKVSRIELRGYKNADVPVETRDKVAQWLGWERTSRGERAPQWMRELTQIPALEHLNLAVGWGLGGTPAFTLQDEHLYALAEAPRLTWIALADEDRQISEHARQWGALRWRYLYTRSCRFSRPRAPEDAQRELQFSVEAEPTWPLWVNRSRYRPEAIVVDKEITDAQWRQAWRDRVDDASPNQDRPKWSIDVSHSRALTGSFLEAVEFEQLDCLDLSYCTSINVDALCKSPVHDIHRLKLNGLRLNDSEVSTLVRRFQPGDLELAYCPPWGHQLAVNLREHAYGHSFGLTIGGCDLDGDWFSRLKALEGYLTDLTLLDSRCLPHQLAAVGFGTYSSLRLLDCWIRAPDWRWLEGSQVTSLNIERCGPLNEALLEGVAKAQNLRWLTLTGVGNDHWRFKVDHRVRDQLRHQGLA